VLADSATMSEDLSSAVMCFVFVMVFAFIGAGVVVLGDLCSLTTRLGDGISEVLQVRPPASIQQQLSARQSERWRHFSQSLGVSV